MNITFTAAAEADADRIAGLRREIWATTYRGIYPDALIDDYDREAHRRKDLIRIRDRANRVFLIRDGEQPIGYFSYRVGETLHITSLYLLAAYQRHGIGAKVMRHVRAVCREQGFDRFTCNCNAHNLPAQTFYERMGGEAVGTDVGHENPREDQITYRFDAQRTEEKVLAI